MYIACTSLNEIHYHDYSGVSMYSVHCFHALKLLDKLHINLRHFIGLSGQFLFSKSRLAMVDLLLWLGACPLPCLHNSVHATNSEGTRSPAIKYWSQKSFKMACKKHYFKNTIIHILSFKSKVFNHEPNSNFRSATNHSHTFKPYTHVQQVFLLLNYSNAHQQCCWHILQEL